jgi:NAD(P)H-dependent FMN reductase
MSKKIKLIIGSTRQNRVGGQISEWLVETAKDNDINLEVIDLKEENLPTFDGPSPAYVPAQTPEGKAWSAKITEGDAFIFLTAEYNRGIPAPIKNSIDHLFHEWNGKPAAIVSYGYIDGGGSATKHLIDVLNWIKMEVVEPQIGIQLTQETFDENGKFKDIDAALDGIKEPFIEALHAITKAELAKV